MKKTVLTCLLLAAISGSVVAQSPHVNQNLFNIYIGKLSKAIDGKDLTLQNSDLTYLTGLMDNSIAYLTAHPQSKTSGPNKNIPVETQIEAYVKALPTNIIVTDKATLISKLTQFANTMEN